MKENKIFNLFNIKTHTNKAKIKKNSIPKYTEITNFSEY
jgi:hypothetical protein